MMMSTKKTEYRLCKLVRTLTIAPLMAALTLGLMYLLHPDIFGGIGAYLMSLLFLCVLPIAGYPLQPIMPYFKNKGREGQRNLALLMALVGYVGGLIYCAAGQVPDTLVFIFVSYLFSGLGVVILNKVFKVRASGHACGICGPMMLMMRLVSPWALLGLSLLVFVGYTSVLMKRHTAKEFMLGALIPVVVVLLSFLVY